MNSGHTPEMQPRLVAIPPDATHPFGGEENPELSVSAGCRRYNKNPQITITMVTILIKIVLEFLWILTISTIITITIIGLTELITSIRQRVLLGSRVNELLHNCDHIAEQQLVTPGVSEYYEEDNVTYGVGGELFSVDPQAIHNNRNDSINPHVEGTDLLGFNTVNNQPQKQEVVSPPGGVTIKPLHTKVENCMLLGNRKHYMSSVICEAKNRFGTPEDTKANRLAVRRYCLDLMNKHGLRPTHIAQVLPVCVSLVFTNSDSDIYAKELESTFAYASRQGPSGYGFVRRLLNTLFGMRVNKAEY